MADFVKVATRSVLKPGQAMRVEINQEEIALFNCNGEFFAIDQVCPHSGGPLADGILEGETVTCPWHGWQFSVKTGECGFGIQQRTYPVKVEGDDVLVSAEPNPPGRVNEKEETRALPPVSPARKPGGLQFVRIGAVNEIADGQGRLIEADGRQIAVFNCGGRFYAIDEICPHMGGPLSEGTVEGDCVICPWHGWEFNIRTGESPTGGNQQTFSVKVEDGSVFVAVPPRA